MFFKTILAFIFVFLSMPVFAQTGAGKIVFTSNRTGNDEIFNAYVTMTDAGGFTRTVSTDISGNYRFEEVEVGETYTFSVSANRRTFNQPEQLRNIIGDTSDVDFTAGN